MHEAQRVFPQLKMEDIYYSYAGLRSLPDSGADKPGSVSRAHKTIDHEKTDNIRGIISVLGGKITGGRGIAEEITDLVCKKLAVKAECKTAAIPLPGAPLVMKEDLEKYTIDSGMDLETISYLASLYGSRFPAVLEMAEKGSRGKQALCPHSKEITAQIWYAVAEESAITLSDFMFRRSGLGLMECQGLDAMDVISKEMARLQGWSPQEMTQQISDYNNILSLGQRYKEG